MSSFTETLLCSKPLQEKGAQNSHCTSVASGSLSCLSPLPVAQGPCWILWLPRTGLRQAINKGHNFSPWGQAIRRTPPGVSPTIRLIRPCLEDTDFIPPQDTPRGASAPGWIPSCFQAESQHVWTRAAADCCQGAVDSAILLCRQAGRGWPGGLCDPLKLPDGLRECRTGHQKEKKLIIQSQLFSQSQFCILLSLSLSFGSFSGQQKLNPGFTFPEFGDSSHCLVSTTVILKQRHSRGMHAALIEGSRRPSSGVPSSPQQITHPAQNRNFPNCKKWGEK